MLDVPVWRQRREDDDAENNWEEFETPEVIFPSKGPTNKA